MKIEVWLENTSVTYDSVKSWLGEFKPEDKHIDDEEIQFYITVNTVEDVFEVSNLVGWDIMIGTYFDEPLIRII
jgi:hypothetical protein